MNDRSPPPPPTDPFGPWSGQPKLARRYAAALPLWLALVEEGALSTKNTAAFAEVLEGSLEIPLAELGGLAKVIKEFQHVTKYATARTALTWVCMVLRKKEEREVPLWILVDHALEFGNGNISEVLGLLLDNLSMPTKEFLSLMTGSGDLDMIMHPKPPEKASVRKHCIVTREGKYVEFIRLDG